MNYNYSDFHYPPPPPQPLHRVPPPPPPTDFLSSGLTQKQRKKRTKLVPVTDSPGASTSSNVQKRKYTKPDPAAPKITKPCSECGKTFWSWKALFGHMRCHPERHWRGINPPPNLKRLEMDVPVPVPECSESLSGVEMTEEDHEVAACLLLLANGGHAVEFPTPEEAVLHDTDDQTAYDSAIVVRDGEGITTNCRFECSCCKKVFNSHQALGGHRASHKNVKGCFANTRVEGDEEGHKEGECSITGYSVEPADPSSSSSMALVIRHSCSICAKVFATGQALGGHMRCHWEKSDEPQLVQASPQPLATSHTSRHALDLNSPALFDNIDPSSSNSSGLRLDLRLGL